MLSVGSYLTVNTQGHAGLITPDELARQVTGYLASSGRVDVSKNTVTPVRDILSDILAGNLLSWDYGAVTTVRVLYDTDSEADGVNQTVELVRAAFASISGYDPTGAFLQGENSKGAPTPDTPEPGFFENVRRTLGLDDLLSSVNSDVRLVLYGVIAIVIIVVALVAFGPNVPKLIPKLTV